MALISATKSSQPGRRILNRIGVLAGERGLHYRARNAAASYALMQLKRAVEGRLASDAPTPTQAAHGLTPELAAEAMTIVAEELSRYLAQHLAEGLGACSALGSVDETVEELRGVIG